MDQCLNNAHGTAPPGNHPRNITLEQIPGYVELYRKTGRPPRVNVKKPWRFDRIDLPTHDRWVLTLSDGRTFLLKHGTNRFEPPIELQAGCWFVIHMARKASRCPRLPEEGLSGWVNDDDAFGSLLSDDERSDLDEPVNPGASLVEQPPMPDLNALEVGAFQPDPAHAPADHPVASSSTTATTVPAFTFGRKPRSEGLLARIRRRVFSRAAA